MKKVIFLVALIPLLLIPFSYATLPNGLSFDEFCDGKINDQHATAADVICELNIFDMHEDIELLKSKVAYVESLTISDYTKDPVISEVVITTDNNEFTLDYTVTSFHERTKTAYHIRDAGDNPRLGGPDTYGVGIFHESYGPADTTTWPKGAATLTINLSHPYKIIHAETFVIP